MQAIKEKQDGRKPVFIRIDAELWRRVKAQASILGITIQGFVDEALKEHILDEKRSKLLAAASAVKKEKQRISKAFDESCKGKTSDLKKILGGD